MQSSAGRGKKAAAKGWGHSGEGEARKTKGHDGGHGPGERRGLGPECLVGVHGHRQARAALTLWPRSWCGYYSWGRKQGQGVRWHWVREGTAWAAGL